MENKDFLPFPEPDSQSIALLAASFMESFGGDAGYTEKTARREAITYLVFGQAMLSGFLEDTGRVILGENRSFSMRPKTPFEKE